MDTSIKISEEKVEKLPTIIVCFVGTKKYYELGQDFTLTSYTTFADYDSEKKENGLDDYSLNITHVDTAYKGKCLNLWTSTSDLHADWRMYFAFKFNNTSLKVGIKSNEFRIKNVLSNQSIWNFFESHETNYFAFESNRI